MWAQLCLPQSYDVEALTPGTSGWDCTWRQGLQRGDHVEMRPLE